MTLILENIPIELRERRNWVCWRWALRDGKYTKPPVNPITGGDGSSTDPETWTTFDDACTYCEQAKLPGVGFVVRREDRITGADLDKCINPKTGVIDDWAIEIVYELDSYTEVTPSGTGLRVYVRGNLPGRRRRRGFIELYDDARYFTVTGQHVEGTPTTIEERQAELDALCERIFGAEQSHDKGNGGQSAEPLSIADEEIIKRASMASNGAKFTRLWSGDWNSEYGSHSEADLALCMLLAFWTGRDASRVDALFRQSGLWREKWNAKRGDSTYGEWTILEACRRQSDTYRARQEKSSTELEPEPEPEPEPAPGPSPHEDAEPHHVTDPPLVLDPSDPMPSARRFVEQFHTIDDFLGLRHQGGVFYQYRTTAYHEVDEAAVRARLYHWLEGAQAQGGPFKPTDRKVDNVLDSLRAVCNLPKSSVAPCWLKDNPGLDPLEIVACRNGLLHIPTRRLLPATPRLFILNGLEFDYESKAPSPENWLKFLDQLWPKDTESIQTLQEWIGYLLTALTFLQKILMIIGPKRAGKGTIGRVIRRLLGARNVCAPTLSDISQPFGRAVLIGKTLALVADARISGRADTAAIVERMLSISGEDPQTIPRKYLPDWNGFLPTRFVILTNELPKIEDASATLASRFIILALTKSFYGREDHGLLDRLIPELPSILLWALEGRQRLLQRGHFVQPQSSSQLVQQFEDLGSPIRAFVRDGCVTETGLRVETDKAFEAWKRWCTQNGRDHPGTVQMFGKNLQSCVSGLKVTRPRILGVQVLHYEGIRLKTREELNDDEAECQ